MEVVDTICQLLDALAATHAAGLVHRDVKSENLLLHQDGERGIRVKLLDFGLIRVLSTKPAGHLRKISVNHVYNLRMGAAVKLAGLIRRSLPNRSTPAERRLRDAIAEIGLQGARAIFDEIAEVFRNGETRYGALTAPYRHADSCVSRPRDPRVADRVRRHRQS